MTCDHCKKPIAGLIEDHDCKGERVIKCTKCGKPINDICANDNSTGYKYRDNKFCKCATESKDRVDQLEKENEELEKRLSELKSNWSSYVFFMKAKYGYDFQWTCEHLKGIDELLKEQS